MHRDSGNGAPEHHMNQLLPSLRCLKISSQYPHVGVRSKELLFRSCRSLKREHNRSIRVSLFSPVRLNMDMNMDMDMGMGGMNGTMAMVRLFSSATLTLRYSTPASRIQSSHWHGPRRPQSPISEHGCSSSSLPLSPGHYMHGRPSWKHIGSTSLLQRPLS